LFRVLLLLIEQSHVRVISIINIYQLYNLTIIFVGYIKYTIVKAIIQQQNTKIVS